MSKANFINTVHIEGYVYEHDLELKVTGENSKAPGTQFISGKLDIATDNALTNIVSVHFTYVTATTKNGKANETFTLLNNLINGTYGTCMKDGVEKALKVRIDSAIALNEFYTDRNGKEELVSAKRNEGGFVHRADVLNENENKRNTFMVDMLITKVTHVDADEDKGTPEKCIVKGAVFNFRKDLLPVEFSATSPAAMNYFEGLDASSKNPTFTCVWGNQISETIVRKIVTESAFGPDEVREVKNTRKDFVINGASREPMLWDDETTITAAELNEMIQKRELDLAANKKRRDEWLASRNSAPVTPAPSNGGFNF